MDCSVCNVRSSMGYCDECNTLLCEDCAIKCVKCSKLMCPDHQRITKGGRILCHTCMGERDAQRDERRRKIDEAEAGGTSMAALDGEAEAEAEGEILTASIKKPPPAWKLALYSACTGLAVIVVMLIFPSMRSMTGPIPTPYLMLLIPALAIVWSIVGMKDEEEEEDSKSRCLIAIGLAVVTVVLAFVAVATDPKREAQRIAEETAQDRTTMTEEERARYRAELRQGVRGLDKSESESETEE